MSILAITDRKILLNITNMENRDGDTSNEMTLSGVDEVREVKGVKAANSTPPAVSSMVLNSAIITQPAGQSLYCSRKPGNTATRKDCQKSTHGCSGKFGRSAAGNQQKKSQTEECLDHAAKKRKTRRGKPKHRKLKPFPKQSMSYEQRLRCRAIGRMTKTGGQPPAPYNTTQFLMEDHSDLPDLDQKLAGALTSETMPASFQKPIAPSRTRDSSFSIDSDEDYFYSSPENEEEFLTKEFSSAYEDLHAERLSTLTKSELIQEYVQLEAKFDLLTKRLKSKNLQPVENKETESKNGTSSSANCDNDLAKSLRTCQQRLDDLMQQNEQLRRENEALRARNRRSPVSSVDSESDSDSSSAHSSCSCSAGSGRSSPNNGKSYQNRREQEHRRNKRRSSVDSESDSLSTTSNKKDSSIQRPENSLGSSDFVNGNTNSHEISGLPT
ncbi:protein HEXIM2 [Venturia canescens]|uniref:protein HEXIM2 n=1 Tax=Venturia canescens TaxID=32260 RepID=UPI001C9C5A5A|nr:protein HEXIM2-like [Venturia canescens]XP_043273955.1 protein HEXIM2-like [Venturia canescens]